MKTWQDVPGWFDWQAIYDRWIQSAAEGAIIVEIGSWIGRSTCYAGQAIKENEKPIKFVAVDYCIGSSNDVDAEWNLPVVEQGGGTIAGILHRNLIECGVKDFVIPMVTTSKLASELFADGSVDHVFVDGAHDYKSARTDLDSWWPKIRKGGSAAGHDYTKKWPGVMRAVDEFFGRPCPSATVRSCWEVTKS